MEFFKISILKFLETLKQVFRVYIPEFLLPSYFPLTINV